MTQDEIRRIIAEGFATDRDADDIARDVGMTRGAMNRKARKFGIHRPEGYGAGIRRLRTMQWRARERAEQEAARQARVAPTDVDRETFWSADFRPYELPLAPAKRWRQAPPHQYSACGSSMSIDGGHFSTTTGRQTVRRAG